MPLKGSNERKDQSGMVRPGTIACSDPGFSWRLSAKYRRAGRRSFRLPWMLFRRTGVSVEGKKGINVMQFFLSVMMRHMPGRPQPVGDPLSDRIGHVGALLRPGSRGAALRWNYTGGSRAQDSGRRQGSREQITVVGGPQRSDGGQSHARVESHGVTEVSRAEKAVDASKGTATRPLALRTALFMIQGSVQAGYVREIRISDDRMTCLTVPGHEGSLDRRMSFRRLQRAGSPGDVHQTSHTAHGGNVYASPVVRPRAFFLSDVQRTENDSVHRPSQGGITEGGQADRRSFPRLTGTLAGPQRRVVPETYDGEFSFHSQARDREEVEEIRVAVREVREAVREESRSVQSLRDDVERYIKSKPDIHHLSDQVYRDIERRIRMERERRGL